MWLSIPLIIVVFRLELTLCVPGAVRTTFPRVDTPLGTIEGYYKTSNSGRRYEAYEGIPYAEPPIGDYRFRVAQNISRWNGTRKAKGCGPVCMQYSPSSRIGVEGEEDCLYMNIYTVNGRKRNRRTLEKRKKLLPVIFYIHGGVFLIRSGSENGPKYLLDRDVTLVTFNYRLGPLGFLSTGDTTLCGNVGLKDQVIALQWVKNNIKYFGGDPSRITIIGQSAGGASVHYHYLSKLTRGLFTGGISLSGTALSPWAQMKCPLEKAKKLATIVGCSTDNISAMVDCLRDRPAHQIVQSADQYMPWLQNPIPPFGPVVEKEGCEFAIINRPPMEIIATGGAQDLPWITGVVDGEGLAVANAFVAKDDLLKALNDDWPTLSRYLLEFNYTVPIPHQTKAARLIRNHYLGTNPISRSTINQTIRMISDRMFKYQSAEAAVLHAQTYRSPVRFYRFSYRGAHSFTEIYSGSEENFGVAHLDDLAYVFEMPMDTSTTSEDRAMQRKMVEFWVSFATHGKPNAGVSWPALDRKGDQLNVLHIAAPSEVGMENAMNLGERSFWNLLGIRENHLTGDGENCGSNDS